MGCLYTCFKCITVFKIGSIYQLLSHINPHFVQLCVQNHKFHYWRRHLWDRRVSCLCKFVSNHRANPNWLFSSNQLATSVSSHRSERHTRPSQEIGGHGANVYDLVILVPEMRPYLLTCTWPRRVTQGSAIYRILSKTRLLLGSGLPVNAFATLISKVSD